MGQANSYFFQEAVSVEITEVRVSLINESKLRAFVSITFDDCFVVRGIKIIQGLHGLFVSMPSRKNSRGTFQDIAHPINEEMRLKMDRIVLDAFNQELAHKDSNVTDEN